MLVPAHIQFSVDCVGRQVTHPKVGCAGGRIGLAFRRCFGLKKEARSSILQYDYRWCLFDSALQ